MQIDKFEADTLQQMPIIISQQSMNLDTDTMIKMGEEQKKYEDYPDEKKIYLFDSMQDTMTHTNKFTDEYLEYVNNMDSSLCKGVTYSRLVNMNMIRKDGENYIPVTSANMNWSSYPVSLNENKHSLMNEHYDLSLIHI